MVDAEQTYLQPAIDHCVQYLQQRYNKDRAVVYNTIQCYLKDSRCVCVSVVYVYAVQFSCVSRLPGRGWSCRCGAHPATG